MKIAYISLHWPRTVESSIGKKIVLQMDAWRKEGHEALLFSHMHNCDHPEALIDGSRFVYAVNPGGMGKLAAEFSRSRAAKELVESVRAYQPDIIYLRWAMYVYPIQRLFEIAPVVVEINTHDIREHQLLGGILNAYNQLTRGVILGKAAGQVFATRELMALPDFAKFKKPGVVVTNSVDLKNTPFYPAPGNSPPHLIFIGTPGMAWHGVDKLVAFAEYFPDVIVDIVGITEIGGFSKLPENMILHGFLKGEAYEAALAGADAAIGTISLHVKEMQEAATLKIRDCAARGLPCILPYQDTDLSGLDDSFFLQIPNTPDNITAYGQLIHDFIFQARGKRVPRTMVAERIDSRIKEKLRLNFFQEVLAGRN